MRNGRRPSWVLLGALGLLAAVTGFAWACTPVIHTSIQSVTPPGGTPAPVLSGTQVTATPGSKLGLISMNGGSAPVEVRWNGANGPLLATSESASMATSIQVPQDAEPGVYFVVVVAKDPSGNILSKSSTTVSVTSSPGGSSGQADVSSDLWSGLSATSGSVDAPVDSAPVQSGTSNPGMGLGLGLAGIGALSLVTAVVLAKGKRKQASTS